MSFININKTSPSTTAVDTLNVIVHMENFTAVKHWPLLWEKEQCSLPICALLAPCPLSNSSWTRVNEADEKYILSVNSLHVSSQAAILQCVRHFKIRVMGAISNFFSILSLFLTIMYSFLVIHQLNALEILLLSILIDRDIILYHFWVSLALWAVRLCLTLPGNSILSTVPSKFWLGRSTASVFLSYQCSIFLAAANAWVALCKYCKSHLSHGGHAGIFYVSFVLCLLGHK